MSKQNASIENVTVAPRHASWWKKSYGVGIVGAVAGVTLVLGSVGGFVLGSKLSDADQISTQSSQGGPGGFGGPPSGGMMGAMGAYGEVTSISSNSITVSDTRSGNTSTYAITDTTTIRNDGSDASVGDIAKGDTVRVSPSSDDKKTASSIEINPTMRGPAQ